MNFQEEFRGKFGNKFDWLCLKDVVVKKKDKTCIITFLEPSTIEGLSDAQKMEIVEWLKDLLQLEKLQLKVKFMKVYVEERLILKAVKTFFEKKYKVITPYLNDESFKIKITPIDVIVDIVVSEKMVDFFNDHKICGELSKYLKSNFLVEFVTNVTANPEIVDEVDIKNVEMKTTHKVAKRYNVEIVKEVIGKGILPKPEYLSNIKSTKDSVIVAGFINKFERHEYIAKSGRYLGQARTFFTFVLEDEKGKMECIYFCGKTNIPVMEKLEDFMFVLLHGDVKPNKMGKLSLVVDKIALASKLEKTPMKIEEPKHDKKVVQIERIFSEEQDSMFKQKCRYNNNVAGKNIVVFDIETTGLSTDEDEIIELGAVKICDGKIVEKFSTFAKPSIEIPYEVVNLTGITDEMVDKAPPIEWVLEEFYDFVQGCVLCGHNIINFDIKFIRRLGREFGIEFDNPLLDTYNLARTSGLRTTKFNLGTVTKLLGISLEGAHRAWNDAFATAQVLLKLSEVK